MDVVAARARRRILDEEDMREKGKMQVREAEHAAYRQALGRPRTSLIGHSISTRLTSKSGNSRQLQQESKHCPSTMYLHSKSVCLYYMVVLPVVYFTHPQYASSLRTSLPLPQVIVSPGHTQAGHLLATPSRYSPSSSDIELAMRNLRKAPNV